MERILERPRMEARRGGTDGLHRGGWLRVGHLWVLTPGNALKRKEAKKNRSGEKVAIRNFQESPLGGSERAPPDPTPQKTRPNQNYKKKPQQKKNPPHKKKKKNKKEGKSYFVFCEYCVLNT